MKWKGGQHGEETLGNPSFFECLAVIAQHFFLKDLHGIEHGFKACETKSVSDALGKPVCFDAC